MKNKGNREENRRHNGEDFDRDHRSRGRSMRSGYGSMPSDYDDEYFGGSMQFGEGYSGGGRDYDRMRRGYEGGREDSSQPGFGRSGNFGGEYDSGTYRRTGGGYSQGFGSEASRRHSGVGYSGRSGFSGEDSRSRYGNRFAGQGAEDLTDYDQYQDSERGYRNSYGGGMYGGRERGWWDRTSDEVASWFGDDEAARRRDMDSRREGQYRGRGPSDYTRSDERIKEDINDRLTDHPYIDASNINVESNEGEVTLSGTVESRYEKRLAEDVAEDVSGVKNVENRVRVNNTYSTSSSWNRASDTSSTSTKSTGASSGS
jgi:osmotically-inducible protein OsmY